MPSNNPNLPIDEAHYAALNSIIDDAANGLIPCQSYLTAYFKFIGEPLPEPAPELTEYLNNSKRLLLDTGEFSRIQKVFSKYNLRPPIGIEDMPILWGRAFESALDEVNWVGPNPEETKTYFQWDYLQQFGAYLAIQYPRNFDLDSPGWPLVGQHILMLHQLLEPGPFTPRARLCEFFEISR